MDDNKQPEKVKAVVKAVVEAVLGVPVNLAEGREIEIHAKPGEVAVLKGEVHKGKFRGRLKGGTFVRKPVE